MKTLKLVRSTATLRLALDSLDLTRARVLPIETLRAWRLQTRRTFIRRSVAPLARGAK